MKSSQDLLSSVLKTTQMGQVGIRSIVRLPMSEPLQYAVCDQLREYDALEDQAHALAARKGWELPELAPIAKTMSAMMVKAKLVHGTTDSKIAQMLIQGNTMGMIKSLKNLHRYHNQDAGISQLSEKLLQVETENIRQMKQFL